jgi:hypothetical protein
MDLWWGELHCGYVVGMPVGRQPAAVHLNMHVVEYADDSVLNGGHPVTANCE